MSFRQIKDIQQTLNTRSIPTIPVWNRLEGRPRTKHFDRALKAEVRDPLWMLSKQWQMGEFRGDDAGSPVFAKIHMETTRLNKFQPQSHATQWLDDTLPLEAKVEQRPLFWQVGQQKTSLDLRLAHGKTMDAVDSQSPGE